MPNVVGIWDDRLSQEEIQSVLVKKLARVRVPSVSYQDHCGVVPGVGMALQDHGIFNNGSQPVWSEDRRYMLILDGELYNGQELQHQFREQLTETNLSDPKLCAELFRIWGDQAVLFLNGLFCIILYDLQNKQLKIISDRLGFRPMFYALRGRAFHFATEMKALGVGDLAPRKVDEMGVLSLFAFGSHIMHRTWIEDYSRLPPATKLVMSKDGMRLEPYWAYQYDEQERVLDQETYFTCSRVLIDRAVERAMKGDRAIGIFLSGGYDSRVIASAIRRHHVPIPALTFGDPESRDVRYAEMIAARIGLRHYPLTDCTPYLYRHCHAIVWRTEGMLPFYNTTSIRFHPFIKSLMDIVLVGFLGEFWGSHAWPQLLLSRSRQSTIETIFNRLLRRPPEVFGKVFLSSFLKETFQDVREEFTRSFESLENEHPLNIADSWNFRFLQPRTSFHSTSIDRYLFEVRAPLLDCELVEYLLKIPPRARLEQRVYKKTIAYGFPTVRDIPCTNSALPVNPNFLQEYFLMVMRLIGRKARAPLFKLLSAKVPLDREFRNPDEDLRREPELLGKILRPMMGEGIFPEHIFDYGQIHRMLDEHVEGHSGHYEDIYLLISYGLAMKFFLYDDVAGVPPEIYSH